MDSLLLGGVGVVEEVRREHPCLGRREFDGVGDPELEIELTLPGRPDERAPDIE